MSSAAAVQYISVTPKYMAGCKGAALKVLKGPSIAGAKKETTETVYTCVKTWGSIP